MTQEANAAQIEWDIPTSGSSLDDPLLGCLLTLTKLEQRPHTADALTAGLPLVDNKLTPELFIRAARRADLSARVINRPLEKISNLVLPAVLLLNGGRACILEHVNTDGTVSIIVPESGDGKKRTTACRTCI
jgi:ATP-binding cassette subfamily C protein LapB